ncbi:hypothetical protein F2Q70_00003872 [Brassica cretica]|uniref:Uncharacterized protein n=1 Tax=Brassica cretica TaxID=69181 RepID=A0A8S9IL87_BRACR|nr:hypothetical protein F2Q70_00003872 [Brassica cretica]
MIGYRLENDLLKNIRPNSRMEKFCTRLSRASCSDPVGPVDLSLGPWSTTSHSVLQRWTTLDVDWMWAVVEIAPVVSMEPFVIPLRSIGQLRGNRTFVGRVVLQFLVLFAGLKSLHFVMLDVSPQNLRRYPPEAGRCWRAPLSSSPMTFVPLAYGAIFLFFAQGRHSLCAYVLSGIDLGLESESVVWIAGVGLLSAPAWVSHSQHFTMPFNVQAAVCFPLGEPLSTVSGHHSMTRRLVLNLLCQGHVNGGISGYMARKSGSEVAGTLDPEPGSWDPEPGSLNPEPRGLAFPFG